MEKKKQIHEAAINNTIASFNINDSIKQGEKLNAALEQYSKSIQETALNKKNMNAPNRRGFLFENHHVNSHNIETQKSRNPLGAFTDRDAKLMEHHPNPIDETTDIRTKDGSYEAQLKAYKTGKDSAKAISKPKYDGKEKIVPSDQVEDVKKTAKRESLRNKDSRPDVSKSYEDTAENVTDSTGKSKPVSSEELKDIDRRSSKGEVVKYADEAKVRKEFERNEIKNDIMTGYTSAAIGEGISILLKIKNGEDVLTEDQFLESFGGIIRKGTENSIKHYFSRKAAEKIFTKDLVGGILKRGNIATFAVSTTYDIGQVLYKYAIGQLDEGELVQKSGELLHSSTAIFIGSSLGETVGGSLGVSAGKAIGGAIGTALGPIGILIGSIVGGYIFGKTSGIIIGSASKEGIQNFEADYISYMDNLQSGNIYKAVDIIGSMDTYEPNLKHLIPGYGFFSQISEYNARKNELNKINAKLSSALCDAKSGVWLNALKEQYNDKCLEIENNLAENLNDINSQFESQTSKLKVDLECYKDLMLDDFFKNAQTEIVRLNYLNSEKEILQEQIRKKDDELQLLDTLRIQLESIENEELKNKIEEKLIELSESKIKNSEITYHKVVRLFS